MNGPTRYAIAADHIFDGWTKHKDSAVVIEGSRIVSLLPKSELSIDLSIRNLPSGFWLAPGFIDLQVNGGGDVLFNNSPTSDAIATMVAAHRKFGTTALLPTLITDTFEKTKAAMAAAEAVVEKEPGLLANVSRRHASNSDDNRSERMRLGQRGDQRRQVSESSSNLSGSSRLAAELYSSRPRQMSAIGTKRTDSICRRDVCQ
jgi:hypothetical protein